MDLRRAARALCCSYSSHHLSSSSRSIPILVGLTSKLTTVANEVGASGHVGPSIEYSVAQPYLVLS
jgi:hypothetical protein